jgi:hypothetical protein
VLRSRIRSAKHRRCRGGIVHLVNGGAPKKLLNCEASQVLRHNELGHMATDATEAVAEFAKVALGFCDWCESSTTDAEREASAAAWLARLYASAIALPKVGPENSKGLSEISAAVLAQAQMSLKAFAGCYYREFFNPDAMLQEAPVVGDLEDDLLDTYKDIKRGLLHFTQGETAIALWHWSFLHRSHWGRHAASAIYALHCKAIATGAPGNVP